METKERIYVNLLELHEDMVLMRGRDFPYGKKFKFMPGQLYWVMFKLLCDGTTDYVDGKWVTKAECTISQKNLEWLAGKDIEMVTESLRYLEKNGYLTIVETGDRKNSIHVTLHDFGFFRFQPGDWADANSMKQGKFSFSREDLLG